MARWRVLAVDDETESLDLIRMALADNYDVMALTDPTDIPEVMSIFEPDLLILDIMMPKMSGFQVLEYLHKTERFRDIPTIVLSAKNSTIDIKHGYQLGANIYLTKPIAPDRLERNIGILFDRTPPEYRPKRYSVNEVHTKMSLKKHLRMGTALFGKDVHPEEGISKEMKKSSLRKRDSDDDEDDESSVDRWVD